MNELLIFLMTHRTLVTFNYEATRTAFLGVLPKNGTEKGGITRKRVKN